jgi:hypothetical protein
MSYATTDFSESLSLVDINPTEIEKVLAAWGAGDGQGVDTGPGWSAEEVTDWSGGFLFRMKDGRIAYVSGWCDYTGWGCQDGAKIEWFEDVPPPPLASLKGFYEDSDYGQPHDWDEEPADLNRWLAAGAPSRYDA